VRIPASIDRRLGWYVYVYVNPLDGQVFYIGKGKGGRALAHLGASGDSTRARKIRQIRRAGKEPRIEFLAHGLSNEATAFRVEAAAIDLLGLTELTNLVRGKHSLKLGRMPLAELVAIYSRRPVRITEPAILIRITQLYHPSMSPIELYDATRGNWKVGAQRERARLALAVFEGTVREVYEIEHWVPAGSTFTTRVPKAVRVPGRWEFVGRLAPEPVRRKYLDRDVTAYFRLGAQNPIAYVNISP
jgi:hypothetical protein